MPGSCRAVASQEILRGGGCTSCLILRDAAMRAIHLLAPDSCKAGLGFNSSFSLGRKILGGMMGKKPLWNSQDVCWWVGMKGFGFWGHRGSSGELPHSALPAIPSFPHPLALPPTTAPGKNTVKCKQIPITSLVRKAPGPGLEPEEFFSPPEKKIQVAWSQRN